MSLKSLDSFMLTMTANCSCHNLLLTESDMSHFIPKQKLDTEGITLLTQDNLGKITTTSSHFP